MKKIIFSLFFIVFLCEILAQSNVTVINKDQPIKKVEFNWNNNDLEIFAILDTKEVNENEITFPYIKKSNLNIDLHVDGFNRGDIITSNAKLDKVIASTTPNGSLKFIFGSKDIYKREWVNGIKGNRWSRLLFNFSYWVNDGSKVQLMQFPFYKDSQNLPSLEKSDKISNSSFTFSGKEITLELKCDYKFVINDIKIKKLNGTKIIAQLDKTDKKNILEDSKLTKIFLQKIDNDKLISGQVYKIEVNYDDNKETVLENTIFEDKQFVIDQVNLVHNDNKNEEWKSIQSFNNEKITLEIETNANEFKNLEVVKVEFTRAPREAYPRIIGHARNVYEFTLDPINGKGIITVDLEDLKLDGLYQISFSGSAEFENAEGKDINKNLKLLGMPKYLNFDTKNTVKSLKFEYGIDKVILDFGLEKDVNKNLVGLKNLGNIGSETINTFKKDSIYRIELSNYKKGQFNTFQLHVSNKSIFDFSFKVVNEDEVKELIETSIKKHISLDNSAKRKLSNHDVREAIVEEISFSVLKGLVKNGDPILPEDKKEFIDKIKIDIETYLVKIVEINSKAMKDNVFWETTVGQITSFVGRLALRFLGIVITPS